MVPFWGRYSCMSLYLVVLVTLKFISLQPLLAFVHQPLGLKLFQEESTEAARPPRPEEATRPRLEEAARHTKEADRAKAKPKTFGSERDSTITNGGPGGSIWVNSTDLNVT